MYKLHLFICSAGMQTDGKCGHKGSENLIKQIRERCKNEIWAPEIRVNISGCLGYCQRGIVAVLYPQGQWFFKLKENDSEFLFEILKKAIADQN